MVVGIKIKGIYLSYMLFWIVFFVPAIIHYDLVRILIRKMLPLLEQLDHSMKYERRSILDKSELLVDVKLPQSELDDEEEEDQYLESFRLDENQRREFERFGDNENEDDSESIDEYVDNNVNIEAEYEEDQEVRENVRITTRKTVVTEQTKDVRKYRQPNVSREIYDSDAEDSMLPDDTLPNISEILDSTTTSDYGNINAGDHVIRRHKTGGKNRPSVLNYYDSFFAENNYNGGEAGSNDGSINRSVYSDETYESKRAKINLKSVNNKLPKMNVYNLRSNKSSSAGRQSGNLNEQDIDETFDFLDEELNKY